MQVTKYVKILGTNKIAMVFAQGGEIVRKKCSVFIGIL